jgi:YHS domain-containing protein
MGHRPVCWMQVDRKMAPSEVYKSQTYYFCSKDHKKIFDAKPDKFVALLSAP